MTINDLTLEVTYLTSLPLPLLVHGNHRTHPDRRRDVDPNLSMQDMSKNWGAHFKTTTITLTPKDQPHVVLAFGKHGETIR